VVVIDPTVGSTRKAIVAKSKRGQYFVLPDNGLLTLVEQRDGVEGVHEITNTDWMIGTKMSSTFHGRDIFSPVGAHVARGDDWTKGGSGDAGGVAGAAGIEGGAAGRSRDFGRGDCDRRSVRQSGDEPGCGGFSEARLPARAGSSGEVGDKEMKIKFVRTFSDVPLGQPLLYIDSRGHFAMAVNQGSFRRCTG
jgi:S-adenosylmethionine hydrolase